MAGFAGAPDAWEIFSCSVMFRVLEDLSVIRTRFAAQADPRALFVAQLIVNINADLELLALRTAEVADKAIKGVITRTERRPATTHPHHLRDSIQSVPLPFGGVAVGLLEELAKVENPQTGGVYWLTQEEGSRETGNSMTGRVLFGKFEGPNHFERPMEEYRGVAGAPGSEFLFGQPGGGYGTIAHEIEGRHFLRQGADEAFAYYVRGLERISTKYSTEIVALIAEL